MPIAGSAQPGTPPPTSGAMPGMQMPLDAPPGADGMQTGGRPGMARLPPRGGVKKTLKRKERDPNRAPRTKSTYNLFMKAMVGRLKREHPMVPHREAFKEAARLWTLSPGDGSTPVDTSNFGGPPSEYILTGQMKEEILAEEEELRSRAEAASLLRERDRARRLNPMMSPMMEEPLMFAFDVEVC